METVKRSVVVGGWGEGGMNRQSTGDLQSTENTLYDTIMVDTCHNTLVKIHSMYSSKSEP